MKGEVSMKYLINNVKWYGWFIKESQSYMKGYNPVVIFFKSLVKGFGFVKDMNGRVYTLNERRS
jgi:hypothetical protein